MELDSQIEKWFLSKYKYQTELQKKFFFCFNQQKDTLVIAPTGFGKTSSTFIAIINYLYKLQKDNLLEEKIYFIYISPLKSLLYDVEKNLIDFISDIEKSLKIMRVKRVIF